MVNLTKRSRLPMTAKNALRLSCMFCLSFGLGRSAAFAEENVPAPVLFSRAIEPLSSANPKSPTHDIRRYRLKMFGRRDSDKFVSIICERDDQRAAFLILSPENTPYAYFSDSGAYFAAGDEELTLHWFKDQHFALVGSTLNSIFQLVPTPSREHDLIRLDLFRWGHSLLAIDTDSKFDPKERQYEFIDLASGTIRIRFNDPASDAQFPIAKVDAKPKAGKGYEIDGIETNPVDPLRSILRLDEFIPFQPGVNRKLEYNTEKLQSLLSIESIPQLLNLMNKDNARIEGIEMLKTFRKYRDDSFPN